MTRLVSVLVALGILAGTALVADPAILDAGNAAVERLDQLGAQERARQVTVREYVCEAFPNDCPEPVQPWVNHAPLVQP